MSFGQTRVAVGYAGHVSGRGFHLDDIGAPVREHPAHVGPGGISGQVDHPHPGQRFFLIFHITWFSFSDIGHAAADRKKSPRLIGFSDSPGTLSVYSGGFA
jgi:hypothetical protein